MAKKKLILSQEQIKRICEGEDFVYLSNLASKPDMGDVYSTEITTDVVTQVPVEETADSAAASDASATSSFVYALPICATMKRSLGNSLLISKIC